MKIFRWLRTPGGLVLALAADVVLFGGPHRPDTALSRSVDRALVAQAQVNDRWIDAEGVVGTAVGLGPGGKAVVMVYLSSPGAAVLPARVAGVPVVTEVTGPFSALHERFAEPPAASAEGPPGGSADDSAPRTFEPPSVSMRGARASSRAASDDDEPVDPKRGFPRPVPIGVSTGHPNVTAGTIGARVTDGVRVYALSNNHVFANNNDGRKGDNLLQPGVADGGVDPDDIVATLHDFEPIGFCRTFFTCPLNRIDAALALTSVEDLDVATPEGGYGAPRSRPVDAELSMSVQKYGRTTGHTEGVVTGLNATIDVNYRTGSARFEDQIVITGRGFSAGGDSGSLIVTKGSLLGDRRPVGLLFAGSANSTIANPIDVVLDRFGVMIDGG